MTDLVEKATKLRIAGMRCNCELDKWAPEPETGHSWVCRIHKAVKLQDKRERDYRKGLDDG